MVCELWYLHISDIGILLWRNMKKPRHSLLAICWIMIIWYFSNHMIVSTTQVLEVFCSSNELLELIHNVDAAYHSGQFTSKSYSFDHLVKHVPLIREQLQVGKWIHGLSLAVSCERYLTLHIGHARHHWNLMQKSTKTTMVPQFGSLSNSWCILWHIAGLGLSESDADGSFLHERQNSDLRLFSVDEEGAYNLLQVVLLFSWVSITTLPVGSISPTDCSFITFGSLFHMQQSNDHLT
jgi:hypothetical protein